jgi:hypothetical protein
MKVTVLVILGITITASMAFPGFDARDVMRLVATADPNTCNCVTDNQCNIAIPYTSYLGISCDSSLKVGNSNFNRNIFYLLTQPISVLLPTSSPCQSFCDCSGHGRDPRCGQEAEGDPTANQDQPGSSR